MIDCVLFVRPEGENHEERTGTGERKSRGEWVIREVGLGRGKENRGVRGSYGRLDEAGNVRGETEHYVSFRSLLLIFYS